MQGCFPLAGAFVSAIRGYIRTVVKRLMQRLVIPCLCGFVDCGPLEVIYLMAIEYRYL